LYHEVTQYLDTWPYVTLLWENRLNRQLLK